VQRATPAHSQFVQVNFNLTVVGHKKPSIFLRWTKNCATKATKHKYQKRKRRSKELCQSGKETDRMPSMQHLKRVSGHTFLIGQLIVRLYPKQDSRGRGAVSQKPCLTCEVRAMINGIEGNTQRGNVASSPSLRPRFSFVKSQKQQEQQRCS
jgi:hypothetical protein